MTRVTWRETRKRLHADRERLLDYREQELGWRPSVLWLDVSYQSVALGRLMFLCLSRGHPLLARFFWQLNIVLTGCDISMLSDIGGGFVVARPLCVTIAGRLGQNCTVHGPGGVGGGTGRRDDIGAGPGLPVLSDGVELGPGAIVLGPVTIGAGARIGASSVVTRSVPAGAVVPPGERKWRASAPDV